MKFGMLNFFEHPAGGKTELQVIEEQLDCMRLAEDLGFDFVWAPEHHFTDYGYCSSPMLMLAAVASVTQRIRLGTGVLVLPFNDPVRIAEECAMLDMISKGRLEVGVGRGFQPVEFQGFGVEQAHSRAIFEEALTIMIRAWTEPRLNFEGAHFRIPDQSVRPKPVQKPHPPLWMAAVSDESYSLAGKLGFNLLCPLIWGFQADDTARLLESYRGALRAEGHKPADKEIGALCMVYCAETTDRARKDFGESVLWFYRTIADHLPQGKAIPGYERYEQIRFRARTANWQELLETGALICGNPDVCVRQIERLRTKYGITQLLCWTRMAGLHSRKALESMEMIQKYVMPHFKAKPNHAL